MIYRRPYYRHYIGSYEKCDDICEKCIYGLTILDIVYCGFCPGRCGQHEVIKGSTVAEHDDLRRCILCKHYAKSLKSEVCLSCLGTHELDNYVVDPVIENEPWFVYRLGHKKHAVAE